MKKKQKALLVLLGLFIFSATTSYEEETKENRAVSAIVSVCALKNFQIDGTMRSSLYVQFGRTKDQLTQICSSVSGAVEREQTPSLPNLLEFLQDADRLGEDLSALTYNAVDESWLSNHLEDYSARRELSRFSFFFQVRINRLRRIVYQKMLAPEGRP